MSNYNNNKTKNMKIKIIKGVVLTNIPGSGKMLGSLDLSSEISDITNALGGIYRFYRYNHVHFKIPPFINNGQVSGDNYVMACTYIPADAGTNLPTNIADIEGTNVGLFSASVLAFQHFTVKRSTLKSQNYKWWTTPAGTGGTDEDIQGTFVFVTNDSLTGVQSLRFFCEIDLEVEFKTLLDPALL